MLKAPPAGRSHVAILTVLMLLGISIVLQSEKPALVTTTPSWLGLQ
jgi:hypothetical protein